MNLEFFIDPNRCIGCQSCVAACSECDTHRGVSMIHLQYVDRPISVQTVPVVCNNCVLACPFGVPKMQVEYSLMMKCDMCYDRTSVGSKPMCASVCPSGALYFGTREEMEHQRPQSQPVNTFQFGNQV